jgi:AcrR family transcriptional regulator
MTQAPAVPTTKSYHHGDLAQALLKEAERILESEGIQALTLRAAARGVGVSHTAPRNHFGDLTGLLSELAAAGYRRFTEMMTQAADAVDDDPRERLRARGRAYIRFAYQHPGLFTLMFRSEQLDLTRPSLQEAMSASRQSLDKEVTLRTGIASPIEQAARIVAVRSLTHGYAVLMLDNRLKIHLAALPETDVTDVFALFDAMLDSVALVGVL